MTTRKRGAPVKPAGTTGRMVRAYLMPHHESWLRDQSEGISEAIRRMIDAEIERRAPKSD